MEQELQEAPAMPELDALAGQVAAADAGLVEPGAPGAPGAEMVPAGPDYHTEASGAVDMFAALVVGYCPEAAPIWNDGRKAQIAAPLAAVMEKYGWTFGGCPPELLLAIMAGPPLVATIKLVKKQAKADQEEADAKAKPAAEKKMERAAAGDAGPELAVHSQMGLYKSAR